ncbi:MULTISPECIES: aromatic ring-hydroxylating oxygenase subunit alpha [Alteromonadaceae]|uniref:aromatic ring-hydroxylating oxygenase subunit alpha n=1 Tax=Alteromonadaceae TaxID=72275 RepID=UPI001C0A0C44|nr:MULTISPECIES: aromatic ring-hydroxylating dioxygenase subunit alpha [Aliiglaciecola]MBU2880145.1 aromatic ring-hydroxylating dioxygenase subunit alpha [Aliiglaciecola lipolytica]MDO6710859.1 aromatic ring-hydroxylating dioxygenase subunit alpha [Aliiglaciecola sp. 2_MG-2023]MDO6752340.1 aromatic ring-hydroxylating dioxygenase subunit alpha [Aliiglaciecola sp. 1_MG-2023]
MNTEIKVKNLNSTADLVLEDRVHKSLYSNPEIFDEELDKIFNNTWVWVAHESEVPESGSYKTASIGRQPVIVVRDRKNNIHVMLNRCRHRGATVCEGKTGKTKAFTCPYHGWGYGLDGSLRALPKPEEYENILDKAEFGLVKVRTESYNGMVFATLKDDLESLDEHLGGAKKWIDLFVKQGGGYPLKTLGDHRFRFPGNWKIQLENTTDAYHFPIVHKSFIASVDEEAAEVFDFLDGEGYVEDLGNGHSVMVMIPELVDLEENLDEPIPERYADLAKSLADEGHSDEEVRRLVRAVGGSGFNLNLFPNIACSMAFFRNLVPISANETEIHHIAIGGKGAPEAFNQKRMRLHEHFQGPMGFGTPDDGEAWERVQAGSIAGTDGWIMINRGLSKLSTSADGNVKGAVCSETGMRAAYQKYKKMMSVESGK